MLYYMDHLDNLLQEGMDSFETFLSCERYAKAMKYRYPIDQLQSILAYVLLRYALIVEHDYLGFPSFQRGESGKPILSELPQVYFNVAHCKTGVACVLDTDPVGVDIQNYVPYDEELVPYFMSEEEKKVARTHQSSFFFTRTWALKESYGKWLGVGILYDMADYTAIQGQGNGYFNSSFMMPNFVLATTTRDPQFPQRVTWMEIKRCLSCQFI